MPTSPKCPTCGAEIIVGAIGGRCARCLFRLALEPVARSVALAGEQPLLDEPGDIIGRYKLLQQIGEGGCGVVYMAEQEEPVRRRVAIKVIKLGMDTKNVIARFEAERQAMALMDHPNIAKVLDAGATDSGRPFFVMELVRGVKITEFCDQKNLSTRERLDLFVQVCNAIQHAHQKGVIHRDIKPSNILVTLNDGVPLPKVIDFGIAKATQQRLTDKTLFTAFEQFIGTPAYMSPEQAEMNASGVDTRSDIYSLGVLLYELLTGQTPFDAKSLLRSGLDEIRRIIREQEPVQPSTRLSTLMAGELTAIASHRGIEALRLINLVRGDLDWIVMKTLEKDRTRRYETANGLASDVQRHLNNEPVSARPPSGAYLLQKAIRRHKGAFVAGAAIAIVLLAGAVVSTTEAIRATRAQQEQSILRQRAEQAAEQARESEDEARRRFYAAQINLANQAWEAGQLPRTLDLLETLRPRPGQEDLRGFEWYHLRGLCDGQLLHIIPAHSKPVGSVAFSPDGSTLASCSEDGTICLWDTDTGRKRFGIEPEPHAAMEGVVFTADGKTLISGGSDNLIRLWDANTGELRATLAGNNNSIRTLAVSSDGKTVASAGNGGEIILWDLTISQQRTNFVGRRSTVRTIAFSTDNSTLATGAAYGEDGVGVDLWNSKNGSHKLGIKTAKGVVSLAFSPDGKMLATAGWSALQLWDANTGQLLNTLKGHEGNAQAVAFLPDGKSLLSCGSDRTVRLWELPSNETNTVKSRVIGAHLDSVLCLAVSQDGTKTASGASDGSIKLWNISTIQGQESAKNTIRFRTWPDAPRDVPSSAISGAPTGVEVGSVLPLPDNKSVLLVTSYGTEMRDLKSGKLQATWPDATGFGTLSPDGKLLATGMLDGEVKLWEVVSGRLLASIQANPSGGAGICVAVAFSPDGRVLATGGANNDQAIKLWDPAASLKFIREIQTVPCQGISALNFSPDGKMLAAALLLGRVQLLDVTGRPEQLISAGSGNIRAVVFSPDGKLLATTLDGGDINVWEAQTGNLYSTLKGHTTKIQVMAFSPDGGTLASGSDDHTVRLWDVATSQERIAFRETVGVSALAFSPDGGTLIAGDRKGVVSLRRGNRVMESEAEIRPADEAEQIDAQDYNAMAWMLATDPDPEMRDGQRALEFAEKAVAATNRKDPMILETLAAAYAEFGQFTNAVRCQEEAITLLKNGLQKSNCVSRLKLYESNSPFRTQSVENGAGHAIQFRHQ